MRETPILLAIVLLFASLACGVPEDNKPGTSEIGPVCFHGASTLKPSDLKKRA